MSSDRSLRSRLAQYSDKLVNQTDYARVQATASAIHEILRCAGDFELRDMNRDGMDYFGAAAFPPGYNTNRKCSRGEGIALNPTNAAECIVNDPYRTRQFIAGVRKTVEEKVAQATSPVKLLYAGTGPFAPLVCANLHLFDPSTVKIYFMDINSYSIDTVFKIMYNLGYQNFQAEYIVGDATDYKLSFKPDVLVTETMNLGLLYEPQYWISKNLSPQMAEDGVVVPRQVKVSMHGQDLSKGNELGKKVDLGEVVTVRKDGDLNVTTDFEVPATLRGVDARFTLVTEIEVAEGVEIHPNETQITMDYIVHSGFWNNGKIETDYRPGKQFARVRT
mgnify:CR=1 FL=1